MKKIRAMWPNSHNPAVVDAVKAIRTSGVVDIYTYDAAACREIQAKAAYMPSPPQFVVIEGEEVARLAKAWQKWITYAK